MVLESTIVKNIVKMANSRGAFVFKTHGGPFQRQGLPDLVLSYRGRFIGLEVKRPGNTATELQEHILREIERSGGLAQVVYSVKEAASLLDMVDSDVD